MIRKYRSPLPGHVRVVFELPSCIWADRIYLTGDFNNWSATSHPLTQNRHGVWQSVLDLPLGNTYQFRYMIDGQWRSDSHADGFADNGYSSQNSIVIAELPEAELLDASTSLVRDSIRRRPFHTAAAPHHPIPTDTLHVAA